SSSKRASPRRAIRGCYGSGVLGIQLFALVDFRSLAALASQIEELGPADLPLAAQLDAGHRGGMERERPLDAHAARHLPDGEALADAAAADVGHDALEDLGALFLSLDHAHVHLDRVARAELHLPVRLEPVLEPLDRAHRSSSFFISSSNRRSSGF